MISSSLAGRAGGIISGPVMESPLSSLWIGPSRQQALPSLVRISCIALRFPVCVPTRGSHTPLFHHWSHGTVLFPPLARGNQSHYRTSTKCWVQQKHLKQKSYTLHLAGGFQGPVGVWWRSPGHHVLGIRPLWAARETWHLHQRLPLPELDQEDNGQQGLIPLDSPQ